MIVFSLSWGTSALHIPRETFLLLQLLGVVFFAGAIPISARLAERGRRRVMVTVTVAIGVFGFFLAPLFQHGTGGAAAMLMIGLGLMGLTYGPLGTIISELFPTAVRYTAHRLPSASQAFSVRPSRPTSRCGWPSATACRRSAGTSPGRLRSR